MKFHCILVGNEKEQQQAVEAGWDPKNVVPLKRQFLEGRRMHSLTITWTAVYELIEIRDIDYLLSVIHQQVTTMREKVPVRIDNPNVPPPNEEDLTTALEILHAGLLLRMHGDIEYMPMSQREWDMKAEEFLRRVKK